MASFQSPVDIVNRALQRLSAARIGTLSDLSGGAQEMGFIYDKIRRAELRRSNWVFSTRVCALRALDVTSCLVNFPAWASGTTYPAGSVVSSGGLLWVSLIDGNLNLPPGNIAATAGGALPWDTYFGPLVANAWNDAVENTSSVENTSYNAGEVIYLAYPSANAGNIYASVANGNQHEPDLVDPWSASLMYVSGAVASYTPSGGALTNYQSKINQNFNNEPDTVTAAWTSTITNPTVSGSWKQLANATLSTNPIVYPLTAGPSVDPSTANAFRLPAGFLRPAPSAPKAGNTPWLGAHGGLPSDDWTFTDKYIVSNSYQFAMIFRFIADVQDVTSMDDMFCEGLSCRLAIEAAPPLLAGDSSDKARISMLHQSYKEVMQEARSANLLEEGPIEQVEDELISVRL